MSKKESILEASAKLFSQKGFKDTSISEISKITGAAEGTIFYHFKNKEELFLSILEKVKKDIIFEFEQYFKGATFKNGLDMMEGTISFYLYLAGKMEDQFLLLYRHYPYKLAEANLICRGHLEEIYNCLASIFERAIVVGQKDGSIANIPARKTALIVFSMVDGVVRFKTYNLYDAGALYNELIACCKRMLTKK